MLRPEGRITLIRPVVSVLVLCFAASACTSHMARSPYVKDYIERQDFASALEEIEKIDKRTSLLLYLYESGLALHYSGSYEESNAVFQKAEIVYDDLYTKSLTREAGSLLTSDNILQYRGERFESALIHYYKLLNYLLMGQTEEALVECRRISNKLRTFGDSEDPVYPNDPFLQYLAGMVFFDAGELSDADVSFRNALEAYDALSDRYGVGLPATLRCDLAACAGLLGDEEEAARYRDEGEGCRESGSNPDYGTLNIFLECGYVSYKVEQNIVLPIYKDEVGDDTDPDGLAQGLTLRYGQPIESNRELDYLLRVALPAMVPSPETLADASIQVEVAGGLHRARAQVVENLDAYAHEAFAARQGIIMLKTVTRALTKYLAKEAADDKSFFAGWLVNLFNIGTESADIRSWATLPRTIRMARLELPKGTYDLEIVLHGQSLEEDESYTIRGVEIRPGRATFANFRVN